MHLLTIPGIDPERLYKYADVDRIGERPDTIFFRTTNHYVAHKQPSIPPVTFSAWDCKIHADVSIALRKDGDARKTSYREQISTGTDYEVHVDFSKSMIPGSPFIFVNVLHRVINFTNFLCGQTRRDAERLQTYVPAAPDWLDELPKSYLMWKHFCNYFICGHIISVDPVTHEMLLLSRYRSSNDLSNAMVGQIMRQFL